MLRNADSETGRRSVSEAVNGANRCSLYDTTHAEGSHGISLIDHGVRVRVLMRTRLYAAAANVNVQPTRLRPRCRSLRSVATVFIHPKTVSTH